MTDRQKKFADEYIIDCNATRAYKAAYPNVKKDSVASAAGSRLLSNVKIKAYIDEKLTEISSKKTAEAVEVMEYLTSVMRGESVTRVPFVLGVGDGIDKVKFVDRTPDEKERLRAAELLGKRWGLFKDNVSIDGGIPEKIDKLGEILSQIRQ